MMTFYEYLSIKDKIEISEIARFFWQEAGCPENKDLDFWLLAEKKYKLLKTFSNSAILKI
jgi:hypothetical protein